MDRNFFNRALGRRAVLSGVGALFAAGGFAVVTHSSGLSLVVDRGFSKFGSLEHLGYEEVQRGIGNSLVASARQFPEFREQAREIWRVVSRPLEPQQVYADGLIAGEGVYADVGPTAMGADGRISPDKVVAYFNQRVADGFKVNSIWIASGGVFHGYIAEAPAFVNNQPTSLNESNKVPSNEPVIFVVGRGEKPIVEGINKEIGAALVTETNSARAKPENGSLSLVGTDSRFQVAAEKYSQLLSRVDPYLRTPDAHAFDGNSWDRLKREGYLGGGVGEILGVDLVFGRVDANAVAKERVQNWLSSPVHKKILLWPSFTKVGVGAYQIAGSKVGQFGGVTPDVLIICVADFGIGG